MVAAEFESLLFCMGGRLLRIYFEFTSNFLVLGGMIFSKNSLKILIRPWNIRTSQNVNKKLFSLPSRPRKKVHENVMYIICENHFESSDIKVCKNRKKLKPNVIPTILMPKVKWY